MRPSLYRLILKIFDVKLQSAPPLHAKFVRFLFECALFFPASNSLGSFIIIPITLFFSLSNLKSLTLFSILNYFNLKSIFFQ